MNSRGFAAIAAQMEHYRFVFRWPERSASLLFPAFLLLSLAVHALAFFLFQVEYPPSASLAPPPVQVTLVTPDDPGGAAFLKWVLAQDPAAAGRVAEVEPPAGLGERPYRPSYAAVRAYAMEVEPPRGGVGFPSGRTLLDAAPAPPAPVRAGRPSVANSLVFSEELAARDAAPGVPFRLAAPSRANLRPTVFLVGIGAGGEVRYCFPQSGGEGASSGDPKVDEQAGALLRGHPFKPSRAPLQWGFATFTWGAQAYDTGAPREAAAAP